MVEEIICDECGHIIYKDKPIYYPKHEFGMDFCSRECIKEHYCPSIREK